MSVFGYDISQIYENVTNMAKIYPDHIVVTKFESSFDKRIAGFEKSHTIKKFNKKNTSSAGQTELVLDRTLRRAKTTISDIVKCNNFDMFATFTFGYDRDDISSCKTRMTQWLESQQKQHKLKGHSPFIYVIVPEFHATKKQIHFHALLGGYKGKIIQGRSTKTGKLLFRRGKPVYQIASYKKGFTDIQIFPPTEKARVANYCRKYISKEMPLFENKKRYWTSKKLIRPSVVYNSDILDNPFIKSKMVHKSGGIRIYKVNATISPQTTIKGILWQKKPSQYHLRKLGILTLRTSKELVGPQGVLFELSSLNFQEDTQNLCSSTVQNSTWLTQNSLAR